MCHPVVWCCSESDYVTFVCYTWQGITRRKLRMVFSPAWMSVVLGKNDGADPSSVAAVGGAPQVVVWRWSVWIHFWRHLSLSGLNEALFWFCSDSLKKAASIVPEKGPSSIVTLEAEGWYGNSRNLKLPSKEKELAQCDRESERERAMRGSSQSNLVTTTLTVTFRVRNLGTLVTSVTVPIKNICLKK